MTRTEFERWLRGLYQARLSNDVERCMRFFTAHSTFRLAGAANASSIARASDTLSAIRDQVTELIRVWTWKKIDIYNLVIDGDTAAALGPESPVPWGVSGTCGRVRGHRFIWRRSNAERIGEQATKVVDRTYNVN